MNSQIFPPKLTSLLLIFLTIILAIAYFIQISKEDGNFLYTDFGKFYQSERLLLAGHDPYGQLIVSVDDKTNNVDKYTIQKYAGNLNPPFFQLLILPFGYLSYTAALWLWSVLSIACVVLSTFLLLNILQIKQRDFNLILGITLALLIYFPTFVNIVFGQVTLFLLPLVIIAWHCARRNNQNCLGFLLGIAVSIKLFFGLFALYFLMRRQWRALIIFCGTILVCGLLPVLIFGKAIYLHYHAVLNHIWWYTCSWNASLYGFFARIFGIGEKNTPLIAIPGLAEKLYWFTSAMLTLSLLYFLKTETKIKPLLKIDLDFSIILAAMLLLSPLGWSYYFPLLVIPVITLLQLAKENFKPLVLLPLTCLAVMFTSSPRILEPPLAISGAASILGWSGYYFYGLLLIFGLVFYVRIVLTWPWQTAAALPKFIYIVLFIVMLLPSLLGILESSGTLASMPEDSLQQLSVIKIKDR